MSTRLDRHIAYVRARLMLARFAEYVSWALFAVAVVVILVVIVERSTGYRVPYPGYALLIAAGVAGVAALIVAIVRQPTSLRAAVLIDERLELKEKFSSALALRGSSDPFARAAVRDAEHTADNVSLARRFPIDLPRPALYTLAAACLALGVYWLLPEMDLVGHRAEQRRVAIETQKKDEAKKNVEKALAVVNALPRDMANDDQIKLARHELENLASASIKDPTTANRTALKAMQDTQEAIKNQIKANRKFASAQNEMRAMQGGGPAPNEKGPVADARRELEKGNFTQAINELQKTADNFDKMSDEEKKQTVNQMKQLANQVRQMAQNPQVQQQIQQQLQQAGMKQQQAQQLAKQMQAAAAGDKKAQQQLAQAARQAMQQMNPQQRQAAQQMMQQMQAQANAQSMAQQMAQAAQQMAQGMQQAQQQQQMQQGMPKQGQSQQAAQAQQGQQANQAGQQQMQQAMQQMQAMKSDAAQVAAAQQAAQQAAAQAAQSLSNSQGQGQGQGGAGNSASNGGQNNPGQGQWAQQQQQQNGMGQGNPGNKNGMFAGGGMGSGDRSAKAPAPFGVKSELDRNENDIDSGKLLASTFVKAGTVRGESKEQLKAVVASAEREATDDVDTERVSRQAQKVVHDYFNSMEKEASQ